MAKITFLSSPDDYNDFVLKNIYSHVNSIVMLENCVVEDEFKVNISPNECLYISGNVTFDGGIIHCDNFIPKLVNVSHIEVDNDAEITLEVHYSIKSITVSSGVLNLSNYQDSNLYDINIGTEGVFVNDSNLPDTLKNIHQVTMASGARFAFSTKSFDYIIESARDNFMVNDLFNKIAIVEFIDDNFGNDIINPSLKSEDYSLLCGYVKTPQLDDLLRLTCGYGLNRVENFINNNKFELLNIDIAQDSYLNYLSPELTGMIGKYL